MENPSSTMLGPRPDFKFSFNDAAFSYRVLHIEIMEDSFVRIRKCKRQKLDHEKEEAALMELLNFMYNYTLSVTTTHDLLGVLIAANKFEVTSCVKYCTHLLQKMPMSQENAILYLELHSSVLLGEAVQPLIDAAKQYLVARYRDLFKSEEDAMALPLCAIEAVFGSDALKVSELVLKALSFKAEWKHPSASTDLEVSQFGK